MNRLSLSRLIPLALTVGLTGGATSASSDDDDRQPSPNYAQAMKYSRQFLSSVMGSTSLRPTWIGETDRFWYRFQDRDGTRYMLVDPEAREKQPLFDHVKLAAVVSEKTRHPVDHTHLELRITKVEDDLSAMEFSSRNHKFTWDLLRSVLISHEAPKEGEEGEESNGENPRRGQTFGRNGGGGGDDEERPRIYEHRNFSPDFLTYVFVQDHDLYYVEATEEQKAEVLRLTAEKEAKAKEEGEEGEDDSSDEDDELEDDEKDEDEQKQKEQKQDDQHEGDDEDEEKKDTDTDTDVVEQGEQDHTTDDKTTDDETVTETETETETGDETTEEEHVGDETGDDQTQETETTETTTEEGDTTSDETTQDGDSDQEQDDTQKKETEEEKAKREAEEKKKAEAEAKKKQEELEKRRKDVDERMWWAEGVDEDTATRLSEGGEEKYTFEGRGGFRRGGGEETKDEDEGPRRRLASVRWNDDSTAFWVSRSDSRGVEELFLVNSLSTPRPTLESYNYPMPGEENIRTSELYLFDRNATKLSRVTPKWKDEGFRDTHWGKTSDEIRTIRRDRLLRNIEFISVNTRTGDVTVLFSEGFEAAYLDIRSIRYLEERDELIWWSERSGWAHFYRYDRDGVLKNAITSGAFRASRIVDVDEDKGVLYFRGNGREAGENVYYDHLYRVFLDGTGLTLLDPGDANHNSSLSSSHRFVVDTSSRIDQAPKAVLRDDQGNILMDLETTDVSGLKEIGWTMPETFELKAADGVTTLYGNLYKPFDFDPTLNYPIIAYVYPGPQTEGVSHTFSYTSSRQRLAQVGFIVVEVGHRGGTPGRSKQYHSYGYFNLRDYGLEDKKHAIQLLAARHDWIDDTKVGIYGHSGGGFMTAAALLRPPYNDFFKVGVSSAGNHDNNVYNNSWSERYHGLKEVEVKKEEERGNRGRNGRGGSRGGPQETKTQEKKGETDQEKTKDTKKEKTTKKGDDEKEEQKQDDEKEQKKDDEKKKGDDEKDEEQKDEKKQEDEDKEEEEKKTKFEIKVPTNHELAGNLKGHLLIVHGDMDNNVHPAGSIRLIEALIKENKRFDMLFLPGQRHGFGSMNDYFTQRMYEYFAEHLLGDYQSGPDILQKD